MITGVVYVYAYVWPEMGFGYGYGYGFGDGCVGYRFDTVDLDVTSAEVDGKVVEVSECSVIIFITHPHNWHIRI